MRKKEYYKKKNVGWGGFRMVKNKVKKRTEEKEERMKQTTLEKMIEKG